jgi:hypothetical protein
MPTDLPSHPELALLVRLLDEAYEKKAWHGPNLRGSIRGLTPAEAIWRPAPGRHCIAEVVTHAAYWKYAVWRQLTRAERGSFPLKGSNWFPPPAPFDAAAWRAAVKMLDGQHRALRAAVVGLDPKALDMKPQGSKYPRVTLVQGIAAHDVYHAGQIQVIKRLQRDR